MENPGEKTGASGTTDHDKACFVQQADPHKSLLQQLLIRLLRTHSSARVSVLTGSSLQLIAFTWHPKCKISPDLMSPKKKQALRRNIFELADRIRAGCFKF